MTSLSFVLQVIALYNPSTPLGLFYSSVKEKIDSLSLYPSITTLSESISYLDLSFINSLNMTVQCVTLISVLKSRIIYMRSQTSCLH